MATATERDIEQNNPLIEQIEKDSFDSKTHLKPASFISNSYPADYVQEAQLLLAYASQKGLSVDNKVVSVIVRSRYLLAEETWDAELEVEFWEAFNAIAQLVHPVSVASLKATYPEPQIETDTHKYHIKFFRSKAERTVFFYQIGSLFFLFVLLAIQTFWLMGSMRMASVVELTEQMKALQVETEKQYSKNGMDSPEMDILHGKIEEVQARIQVNYEMLSDWTWKSILQQFGFVTIQKQHFEEEQTTGGISPNLMIQIDILLQEKQFVLQTIQTYILPLLYGLLGAYAYVLIQISKEIKLLTYLEALNVNYRLRLQLGALSGLAVGWFINPDSSLSDPSSVFFELSPLTLAFVTGYSVDVLFALMDRLIYTFSSSESTKMPLANKKSNSQR
jgi:hypothetical protein